MPRHQGRVPDDLRDEPVSGDLVISPRTSPADPPTFAPGRSGEVLDRESARYTKASTGACRRSMTSRWSGVEAPNFEAVGDAPDSQHQGGRPKIDSVAPGQGEDLVEGADDQLLEP